MERYEKVEKLGQGGQGKVYKVRRKTDGGIFVLKTIKCGDNSCLRRAQTEVDIMKGVNHRHIIRLEESFEYRGAKDLYLCIVMDYCPGGDLYQLFRKVKKGQLKPFSEATLVKWITQIASALQYLHERDMWHRDVKTGNIFFDANGNLKLGDFGLSATYNIKGHNTVVGTPYYYAPEVMLGEKYTNKVDIWNLGVCVLELVSLRMQPINAEVLNDKEGCTIALGTKTSSRIMKETIDRGFSKKFGILLCSMLSRHAADRPAAREILQLLCYGKQSELFSGETSNTAACDALKAHLNSLPLFQGQNSPKKKAKRRTLPAALSPLEVEPLPKPLRKSKTSPLASPRTAHSPRDDSLGHSNVLTGTTGSRGGSDGAHTPRTAGHRGGVHNAVYGSQRERDGRMYSPGHASPLGARSPIARYANAYDANHYNAWQQHGVEG